MKIIPQGNTVLIEWVQHQAGNLVLPDNLQMNDMFWKILDVGNGFVLPSGARSPITLKAGDIIILSEKLGMKTLIPMHMTGDRKLAVVDVEAIRCVIEDWDANVRPIARATQN